MIESDIPYYDDPTGFVDGDNTYPCNTQYMVYNPLQHKYFLTEVGLNYYGVDAERRYISSNPNKVRELIEKTTKKVYDTIQYLAGWKNYQVQMYRIATVPTQLYQDRYTFRKQFEQALISQANWIIDNGDSAKYSVNNMEKGADNKTPPEEKWRDLSDVSHETLRTLEFLGLTRWFTIAQFARLDTSKY